MMKSARNLKSLSQLWSEFLTENQRFYTRMVIACKTGPASAWWGAIMKERNADPLLQYLHQARHADEHGIADITEVRPGGIGLTFKPGTVIKRLHMGNAGIAMDRESASNVKVEFFPTDLDLVTVVNRGVSYAPPTQHLGSPIQKVNPISVASLAIEYLSKVRSYAEQNYRS